MTVKSIEEQISTIREATQKAAVSPEAALEFLRRAGIVGISNGSFAAKNVKHQNGAFADKRTFTETK